MAAKTNLGGVFTTDIDNSVRSIVFPSTENICGIIFDTSIVGGLEEALGSDTKASEVFANGNVVELNSSKDMEEAGIDEEVMKGLVKYHLDSFFSLATGTQRLFVSFMNSDEDPSFEAVEKMQLASGGIIYQIGVWTGKPIATDEGEDTYTVEVGNVISKLEGVAEVLGGTVGITNFEGNSPVNILVSAPVVNSAEVDIKKLPDLSEFNCPKVTFLMGQAVSGTVHQIMYDVNHVKGEETFAPVGCLGAALGCLAVAPANESIAHVERFNLAIVTQNAELGFGKIVDGDEAYDETSSFTNIKTLGYSKRNDYLHKKGYVFLTTHDGLENAIFFSSDQTLATNDYRTIARCRVMHKSRRVVRMALLPKVNSSVPINTATGYITDAARADFQNLVLNALKVNMVEPGTGATQISGYSCYIDPTQDVLNTDELKIDYSLVPLGLISVIHVTEGFVSTI